jgi:hypothetical protein
MRANGLAVVGSMIQMDSAPDLYERILTSIRFFARAFDIPLYLVKGSRGEERTPSRNQLLGQRLLMLMLSLESLLIFDDGEPLEANISDRVAFLIENEFERRVELSKFVREMYSKRSSFVHHGRTKIELAELQRFTQVVQACLMRISRYHKRLHIASVKEMRNWFDKQKLS